MTPPFPSREELRSRGFSRETLDQYDQWREAHRQAQVLAARLPEVFGDPPRPRITIGVAVGYDNEWNLSEERVAELSAHDPEQHWWEVSAERTWQGYFIFSDAEGWRFYLPAYMKAYLNDFPNCGSDAVYNACVSRTHIDLLTAEQVAFIDEFVAICDQWNPPMQIMLPLAE
jgi:hypothetical protein